jgi:hypothetical protein
VVHVARDHKRETLGRGRSGEAGKRGSNWCRNRCHPMPQSP